MRDLAAWWLHGGWRIEVLLAYRASLLCATLLAVAVALRARISATPPGASPVRLWPVPVIVWGLQSMAASINASQVDLVASAKASPFLLMTGFSGVIAGLLVLALVLGSTNWNGRIESWRRVAAWVVPIWSLSGGLWLWYLIQAYRWDRR